MKLSDVTPEWIAERRQALGLKDVDIYNAIGMNQPMFSKSMSGGRRFTVQELEAILTFLTSAAATTNLPLVAVILERFPDLDLSDQKAVVSLVESLSKNRPKAP